jgi:membrane protein
VTDSERTDTRNPIAETGREVSRRIDRLRQRYPGLDHVLRANASFGEHYGNHYAAAITYFSVLSLVPILMVAFAAAAIVLSGDQTLLTQLEHGIDKAAPGSLGTTINQVVDTAIRARDSVGIVGLVIALYSGIGWMANLRDALTAQWGIERPTLPMFPTLLRDLLSLIGLGLALVVSFAITVVGGSVGTLLLRLAGLDHYGWAGVLLTVLSIALSLVANWLVFLWVIGRLPRERVSLRSAAKGAVVAAVGFEILKQIASILLTSATKSPTAALFGSVIGILVFANLVSRFLLFVTAWTATALGNEVTKPIPAPPPAVIRPVVISRSGLGPAAAAGLFAVGTLAGLGLRRSRK